VTTSYSTEHMAWRGQANAINGSCNNDLHDFMALGA
jgi:hypothetical protein